MLSTIAHHFPARTYEDWKRVPDSELPTTDPHGHPWAELYADALRERASWCMTGDQHEALRRARDDARERSDCPAACLTFCTGACDPSSDCRSCWEDLPMGAPPRMFSDDDVSLEGLS